MPNTFAIASLYCCSSRFGEASVCGEGSVVAVGTQGLPFGAGFGAGVAAGPGIRSTGFAGGMPEDDVEILA